MFESLLDRFWGDARYEFHHFSTNGTGDRRVAHWPVTVTREDPAAMVEAVRAAAIDYALIWSLCPETFCFTALEALAGGAAILTHRLSGNAASLASERGRGVVLEDEAALWTALETGELSYHQRRAVEHKGQIGFSRMTFDLIEGL